MEQYSRTFDLSLVDQLTTSERRDSGEEHVVYTIYVDEISPAENPFRKCLKRWTCKSLRFMLLATTIFVIVALALALMTKNRSVRHELCASGWTYWRTRCYKAFHGPHSAWKPTCIAENGYMVENSIELYSVTKFMTETMFWTVYCPTSTECYTTGTNFNKTMNSRNVLNATNFLCGKSSYHIIQNGSFCRAGWTYYDGSCYHLGLNDTVYNLKRLARKHNGVVLLRDDKYLKQHCEEHCEDSIFVNAMWNATEQRVTDLNHFEIPNDFFIKTSFSNSGTFAYNCVSKQFNVVSVEKVSRVIFKTDALQ
ncbi:C-type lectin protein [Ranid herpesvirus 3]|uniref:C-type lectin protein n=1 Tax=Ranid herpesvirus 3 TaxID=1987509 RepID=A0A1X9T5H6_9VIRU|nr:C-type lectin protein [Ranid herpesvirus 3]ARR28952.1 C-type lectin protein [Ranid herpesvirus 3]